MNPKRDLSDINVLYVEDESLSRKVMQMTAFDIGMTALTIFENSQNFLERAEALKPRPDLIFLDIHMQPHTGFEMLQMLRTSTHFTGVPIVAMTASVMNEEIDQLRQAGFNGCLGKPIDIDTFEQSVRQILAGEPVWRVIT